MTLISIPGMDESSILNQSTKPSGGGLRPFPCDGQGWTKHTANILKAEYKTLTSNGVAKDYISMTVCNCQYGGEILVGVDVSDIPENLTEKKAREAIDRNMKTLLMAVKILGCHTSGKIDTAKVGKATGQGIELIARHKGFREHDGRHYHKVSLILTGAVDEVTDVDDRIGLPPLPGEAQGASAPPSASPSFDDLPF